MTQAGRQALDIMTNSLKDLCGKASLLAKVPDSRTVFGGVG
jgi:hypothetical protein